MADGAAAVDEKERRRRNRERLMTLVGRTVSNGSVKIVLVRVISSGGQGVVFEGSLGAGASKQKLAVKILIEDSQEDVAASLEDAQKEFELLKSVNHPCIVKPIAHGAGSDGEIQFAWIAMMHVNGCTLEEYVREREDAGDRKGDVRACWPILEKLCKATSAAHRGGVLHRDIKPGNVMLEEDGNGELHVYLVDFGLARRQRAMPSSSDSTSISAIAFGTNGWNALEQRNGDRCTPATDVHALGLVATYMLTRERPAAFPEKVHGKVRPTPGAIGVPVGAWEQVLSKALALHAEDRYQTVQEFWAALEENLPPADVPIPLTQRRRSNPDATPRDSASDASTPSSHAGDSRNPKSEMQLSSGAGLPKPGVNPTDEKGAPNYGALQESLQHAVVPAAPRSATHVRRIAAMVFVFTILLLVSWKVVESGEPPVARGWLQDRGSGSAIVDASTALPLVTSTDAGGVDAPIQARPEVGVDAHVDGPRRSPSFLRRSLVPSLDSPVLPHEDAEVRDARHPDASSPEARNIAEEQASPIPHTTIGHAAQDSGPECGDWNSGC